MRHFVLLICYCFALSVASAQTPRFALTQVLDVSLPIAGTVYQRSNNGYATIVVSGTTRSLFASVVISSSSAKPVATFKPLSVVDGSPTGGGSIQVELDRTGNTFSGTATVPQGWYELSVMADFSAFGGSIIPISNPFKVGVGEVFIIAGQSNAQGLPYTVTGQTNAKGETYTSDDKNIVQEPLTYDAVRVQSVQYDPNLFDLIVKFANINNDAFNALKPFFFKPLDKAASTPDKGIAPTGNSLWYWGYLGQRLSQRFGIPIAFYNAAWGGTQIKAWSESAASPYGVNVSISGVNKQVGPLAYPDKDGNGDFLRYPAGAPYGNLRATLRSQGANYGARAVLWLQGETDSDALKNASGWGVRAINSANQYRDELHKVIRQTRTDFGPIPWVIGQSSGIGAAPLGSYESNVVEYGQELAVTSAAAANIGQVFAGPNMNVLVTARRTNEVLPRYGSEPVHYFRKGEYKNLNGTVGQNNTDGLKQAGDGWFEKLETLLTNNSMTPVTATMVGTGPRPLSINTGNNTASISVPAGSEAFWVADDNGSFDLGAPVTMGATVALNSTGRKRAVLLDGTGKYTLSQAVNFPFTLEDDTPPTDACAAFTVGSVVGYRTYETNVQVVVGESGGCKRALWSTGGVMHENWLPYITATGGNSTTATIRQCLKFEGEACGSTPATDPCGFAVSVNPATASVSGGASVNLSAVCTGPCDGVSYAWAGSGLNQTSGTSVNVTAPASAGQYTYTLTASKANCANKTATAQLTVSGGGSSGSRCAAFTDGTQVAYWSGNPTTYTVKVRDDGTCRQAVWLNGDPVHPNWQNSLTAKTELGFTMADVIYCLAFQDEACKRPASVTPAPAPITAFATGKPGNGMADESPAARVSSGARATETSPVTAETGTELVAYPNPTDDVLTVKLDQPLPAQPRFTLTDVSGRTYEVGSYLSVLSARRIKLSVRHLMPGVYLLQVGDGPTFRDGVKTRTVRFVKQ
jgi:hypothetical protein